MVIDYELCVDILSRIFEKAGADSQNARRQATLFVTTEAKGVYSHGVCLTPKYVQRFLDGAINLAPNIKIHSNAPAVASVDGDQGLGVVVLEYAIDRAMQMAQKNGIGIVTATNLQHYAAGLSYIDRVTDQGMMISITANSPKSMAPYGGSRKFFGTNPLTFAAPMGELPPYCLDMASSVCAGNKLENAIHLGQRVPEGLGLDRNGNPCQDPSEILYHGSLLPFGGAKGSGIAGVVNIMSGILTGAAYQDDVISLCRDKEKPANYGCCVIVLDIEKFMDYSEYCKRAQTWAEAILDMTPAAGFSQVVYPGYLEGRKLRQQISSGVTLPDVSVIRLREAAELVGLELNHLLQNVTGK